MKLQLEKSMRIINDLVVFCHSIGAESYHVDLYRQEGAFHIEIYCPVENADPQKLEDLSDSLNLPRQHEIEQNYWELSGDSELESELTLVGMMLDSAEVEYKDSMLFIRAVRNL